MTGTNVPVSRAVLVGRDGEVDVLAERLLAAPGRLVTVTGCGGVGKTSLALAVARRITPQFADGVWFADLAALRTAEALPAAIAWAVGLREAADSEVTAALSGFVRERQLLLVLDNCEHLIDASAALADALLDGAPGLRILATSREALRITGEQVYAVAPLAVPPAATGDLGALTGYGSVELFLERARATQPDLALTPDNAWAVVEICTRLDGIPLALELAATRTNAMTLQIIAERLSSGFELVIAKGRSRPDRQQTMRATLEWSHDLLSASEQIVLRRLGALAGSWTMEAAEFVCAGDGVDGEVADVVGDLVDKSLVVLAVLGGEARYRLLAPVQEYAAGRLAASGETERVRGRHCEFFVARAERAEPEMHRAQQAAWGHRLDSDLGNMRLAVSTAHARSDAQSVLRLAGGLWWYLWQRGHLREGVRWLEPALADRDVPADARIAGLRAAAMLHGSLGHTGQATGYASEMIELARRYGDDAQVARAATLLGLETLREGDIARTRPYFEQALDAARAAPDPMMIGHALVHLGDVAGQDRGADEAEILFREGLDQFETTGDTWGVAYASNYLAGLLRGKRDFPAAAKLSARAVRLLADLGDRFYLIFAVEDLARAVAGSGHAETAARLFGAAAALRRATGALLSPGARDEHDRAVADLTAALGSTACQRAVAEGAGTSIDALLDEALMPAVTGRPTEFGGPGGALTPRELEVTRLLAAGRSNRQIASQLVITVGTAGVHVEHILRKLDLRSRHQVADWAREHGLIP